MRKEYKTIIFLRHYSLKFPYDHWTNMSLRDFLDLSEGRADPEIGHDITNFLSTYDQIKLGNPNIIYTSTFRRTQQSATAIRSFLKINVPIVQNSLFNEIPSKVLTVPTDEEFNSMKRIGKLSIKKERVLGPRKMLERLTNIRDFLTATSETEILCISHSYLIGQINYFFNVIHGNVNEYDPGEAIKYERGGVLEGTTLSFGFKAPGR